MTRRGARRLGQTAPVAAALLLAVAAALPAPSDAVASGPVAAGPLIDLRHRAQLAKSAVPLTVSWPSAIADGASLDRYELQASRDESDWADVVLTRPRTTRVFVKQRPWAVLQYRLRGVDSTATAGEWSDSRPVWMSTTQEADFEVALSPEWRIVKSAAAYGGQRALTDLAGATASFRFTGRSIGWVARLGPGAGTAEVSVDGGPPVLVDLYRARSSPRRLVFTTTLPDGEHTLDITTTEAGSRVDVDAFVVLSEPGGATLVGAGDIAGCDTENDAATAALAATVEGIVYTTGDNVYPNGTAENFADCYDPAWGALKPRTRPVLGNHEYAKVPGAAPYFAYFGRAAGTPGQGWYRYEAGTWRVYVLNSECGQTDCPRQLEWLKADLEREPHRCVMAMWHRPVTVATLQDGTALMGAAFALLHQYGAEAVLVGHAHTYQRFAPFDGQGNASLTGVRQFIVGTGGAQLRPFTGDPTLVETGDATNHGVLRVDLMPGAYSWQFLPVVPIVDGGYTDSGTDTCH